MHMHRTRTTTRARARAAAHPARAQRAAVRARVHTHTIKQTDKKNKARARARGAYAAQVVAPSQRITTCSYGKERIAERNSLSDVSSCCFATGRRGVASADVPCLPTCRARSDVSEREEDIGNQVGSPAVWPTTNARRVHHRVGEETGSPEALPLTMSVAAAGFGREKIIIKAYNKQYQPNHLFQQRRNKERSDNTK